MQLENPFRTNDYVTVLNHTVKSCNFFKYANFLVNMFLDDFFKKSTLKELCPIQKVNQKFDT